MYAYVYCIFLCTFTGDAPLYACQPLGGYMCMRDKFLIPSTHSLTYMLSLSSFFPVVCCCVYFSITPAHLFLPLSLFIPIFSYSLIIISSSSRLLSGLYPASCFLLFLLLFFSFSLFLYFFLV